jgi:hypothetical protein
MVAAVRMDRPLLSFDDRRIVARNSQKTSVMFDANTGVWPATSTGLFKGFASDTGTRRAEPDGPRCNVTQSNSSNDCTDVPGYGVLCGSSGIASNGAYEIYDPAIGCVASGSDGSSYGTGGNGSNTLTTTLVDSSVEADRQPPSAQVSCGSAPAGAGCATGSLFCGGTSCCPADHPFVCIAQGRCYTTVDEAAAACGGSCSYCN